MVAVVSQFIVGMVPLVEAESAALHDIPGTVAVVSSADATDETRKRSGKSSLFMSRNVSIQEFKMRAGRTSRRKCALRNISPAPRPLAVLKIDFKETVGCKIIFQTTKLSIRNLHFSQYFH